jgi:uncharacterized protein with NRDE domain
MCVFSVTYRVFPDCPIFVLTNRDESTARPTISPRSFEPLTPNGARWFGGADQRAGGTWLGVNEHGQLVATTNRKIASVPANPRSRGLLCRDVLEQAPALDVFRELMYGEYAGFNLIDLSADSADVIEYPGQQARMLNLKPGVHTIGNGDLDDQHDPRVRRTQALVEEMVRAAGAGGWSGCIARAKAICGLHAEGDEPAICLHGENWGTVGSTIVALARDPQQSQYHYAPGPPCRTEYVDYSPAIRALITPPK